MKGYKLNYNKNHCFNCDHAKNMALALNEAGVKVEIDDKNKCPFTEHPIFYDGNYRYTGEDAIDKLAAIGGEIIEEVQNNG